MGVFVIHSTPGYGSSRKGLRESRKPLREEGQNAQFEAETPGFSRRVYRDFTVQVAQVARLDITLEIGTVEQTLDVRAEIPLLQTELGD